MSPLLLYRRVPAGNCPPNTIVGCLARRQRRRGERSGRLGVGCPDGAGEPALVRRTVAERGGHRLYRLVEGATGLLLSLGAVADFDEVGAVAGDEGGAITGRAVARHDDGRLECIEPVEAGEPLPAGGM